MPTPGTIIALTLTLTLTLTLSLLGTGYLYLRSQVRHDPTNDDADFDPRLANLGRRVGQIPPFHPTEIDCER